MLWLDRQGIAVPVAALGRANDWGLLKTEAFKPRLPAGVELRNGCLVHGSDLRLVGSQRRRPRAARGGDVLASVLRRLDGDARPVGRGFAGRRPRGATTCRNGSPPHGAPVYDLAAAETLVEGAQAPTSSGGDQALVDPGGWTILTVAPKPFAPQSLGGVHFVAASHAGRTRTSGRGCTPPTNRLRPIGRAS